MLREHVINFLEAAVVLLALTNAFSVVAAAFAISLAQRVIRGAARPAPQNRMLDRLARAFRVGA
jgi:hypothetical protein